MLGHAAAIAWVLFKLPPSLDAGQIIDGVYHGPVEPGLPVSLIDAHLKYIWRFAFDAALNAPYFGHGIDVSNHLPGASVLIEKFNQALIPSHPHNWLLEVFLETGVFGLAFLLGALALLLRLWLRIGVVSPGTSAAGVALFVAFWSSSMLNFSIWAAWWQGVFLVLSAIVLAAAPRGAGANRSPQSGRKRRI